MADEAVHATDASDADGADGADDADGADGADGAEGAEGADGVTAAEPAPGRARAPLGASFWRLWTSSGLSNLADGVAKVALPLAAVQFTRSPALIAGLSVALTLPWLVCALPAGALADRLDRRRVMLAANGVRAALLAGLVVGVALGADTIWALYVVALGIGAAETLYDTSAQSILPQVVRREQLTRANGRLYAVELTAHQFAGPPLGGLLAAVGAATALAAPAALWALAAGVLLLVPGPFRVPREGRGTLRADIAEGLRFLWRNRLLRTLAAMTGAFNFASHAVAPVFVVYAVGPDSPMGLTEPAFGLLLTATAAGSLVGSLTAERIERALGRSRAMAVAGLGIVALVGTPAATADPFLIGAGYVAGGLGIVVWNVVAVSLRQRITPDRLLGRVNSGYRLLAWGTMPLGAAVGGLVAQFVGLRAVFAGAAALALATLVLMRGVTDAAMAAAERDAARGEGVG